jgi:hypothetical protein
MHFTLGKNTGVFHARSQKQKMVTLSSTEAEVYAAIECTKDIIFFRDLLKEIGYEQLAPTTLHVDNKSAIVLSQPLTKNIARSVTSWPDYGSLSNKLRSRSSNLNIFKVPIIPQMFFRNRSLDQATNKILSTYWVPNAMEQILGQSKSKRHYQLHRCLMSPWCQVKPPRQH